MPAPSETPTGRTLRPGGFTLLEVLLAMAILVILSSGLAGIAAVSLRVGSDLLENQKEEAFRDGFERLVRENLTELPQSSPVRLLAENDLQTLVIERAAGMFPVAGLPLVTESVALETRKERSGGLALWLVYYAGNYWNALQDGSVEEDLIVRIPFCSGFEKLEWMVYNPVDDEWLPEWEEGGRRPHYLELNYRFKGDPADHRILVWLPRLQSQPAGGGQPGAQQPSGQPGGAVPPNGTNPPVLPVPQGGVPGVGPINVEIR